MGAVVSACMHGLERRERARLASAKESAVVSANLDVCNPVDHDPNTIGQVPWLELACGESRTPW